MIGERRSVDFVKDKQNNAKKKSSEQQNSDHQASQNLENEINNLKMEQVQIIKETEEKHKQMIDETNIEVKRLMTEAEEEKKSIFEAAESEGFQRGLQLGKESGYEETKIIIEEAKLIKQEVQQEKTKMVKDIESEVIHLVIDAVKKIIDIQMEEDDGLIINIVKKGLDKCAYTERLIIRTNPADFALLQSAKNRIYMMTEGVDEIEVKNDPALKAGSIIIETSSGTIDSSVETQIRQIENKFIELIQSGEINDR